MLRSDQFLTSAESVNMVSVHKDHDNLDKKSDRRSTREKEKLVEDFMLSNFSVLSLIGGTFGIHQSRIWSTMTYTLNTVMYACVSLTALSLLYSSYLLRDNMSQFTCAFHCFLISCVVMTASTSLTLHRKTIIEFFLVLNFRGPWAEYQTFKFYEALEVKSRQRMLRLILLFLCGYGACGLILFISIPIDMYMEKDGYVTNVTGIYWRGLPFTTWWPYDAHSSTIAWSSCFLTQGIWGIFAPIMTTSAVVLCFFTCEKILNHMKLLTYAIEHLDQRARAKYEEEYKQTSQRTEFEVDYEDCYYECIIQNVKHHHIILRAVKDFLIVANYAIAVPFFGGALLLGLAGMNLLSHDDPRIGPKLFIASVGATEATNMFLLCVYGEKFLLEGEELFNSIINTKWYRRSIKCRKALMILQCGSFRTPKINAAKMIELNMATFANLVNSAYSIFNLNSVASSTEEK